MYKSNMAENTNCMDMSSLPVPPNDTKPLKTNQKSNAAWQENERDNLAKV